MGKALNQRNVGNLTEHVGYQVTVSPDGYYDLFLLTDLVDVLDSVVIGEITRELRIEWGDGSTDTLYNGTARGETKGGDSVSVNTIPPLEDVLRVGFKSAARVDKVYGYEVMTV